MWQSDCFEGCCYSHSLAKSTSFDPSLQAPSTCSSIFQRVGGVLWDLYISLSSIGCFAWTIHYNNGIKIFSARTTHYIDLNFNNAIITTHIFHVFLFFRGEYLKFLRPNNLGCSDFAFNTSPGKKEVLKTLDWLIDTTVLGPFTIISWQTCGPSDALSQNWRMGNRRGLDRWISRSCKDLSSQLSVQYWAK